MEVDQIGLVEEAQMPQISASRQHLERNNESLRWTSERLTVDYDRTVEELLAFIQPTTRHAYVRSLDLRVPKAKQGTRVVEVNSAMLKNPLPFLSLGALLQWHRYEPPCHVEVFEWMRAHPELDFVTWVVANHITVAGKKGYVICEQNSMSRSVDVVYEWDIGELPSGTLVLGINSIEV